MWTVTPLRVCKCERAAERDVVDVCGCLCVGGVRVDVFRARVWACVWMYLCVFVFACVRARVGVPVCRFVC